MSGYEKRILYFDEIENGRKVRNAGFTKLILQGEQCRLSVNINGLHKTDTLKCDMVLLEDEKEVALNRIDLRQGKCSYSCLLTREQMSEKGIRLEDAYGICVRLSEQRLLRAVWRERRIEEPTQPEKSVTTETENVVVTIPEKQAVPETHEMAEERQISEVRSMPVAGEMAEIETMSEVWKTTEVQTIPEIQKTPEIQTMPKFQTMQKIQTMPEMQTVPETQKRFETDQLSETCGIPEIPQITETQEAVDMRGISQGEESKLPPKRISDDKWKQLECVFPLIHPFGDEREYLSIAPKDFIVLTREYQSLANNSFLLHGFYNYHHIILGKILIGGKERFYLGVPGVFYEREKTVAVMFGFESFECAKEPADTGTFGYYMKRVEI